MILVEKKWRLPSGDALADSLPLTHKLLISRGITEKEDIRAFLSEDGGGSGMIRSFSPIWMRPVSGSGAPSRVGSGS